MPVNESLFPKPKPLLDLDKLMTPEEFAKWVGGKDAKWAKRRARQKQIPAVKMGAEWRFHPRTVLAQCKNFGCVSA